jgi:hypothetical protein
MDTHAKLPNLDFGLIQTQVDGLIRATGNRIQTQWPRSIRQHDGSYAVVLGLYRSAENTFWTTRFLLADTPPNHARKLDFALAASPLVRTLVESLAAVVYVFDDLSGRTEQFLRAGWREGVRETDRLRETRGSDPSWTRIIDQNTENLKRLYTPFGITAAQAADVTRRIQPWPLIGRISEDLGGARKSYVTYLNDWFYRTLSAESHPTWYGVGHAIQLLDKRLDEGEQLHELKLYRTKQIAASLALMLALATEIDRELAFGDQEKAKYVWSILNGWDADIRDLYDHLYAPTLGSASTPAVGMSTPSKK